MAFVYSIARCCALNLFHLRFLSFITLLGLLVTAGACQEPASPKPAPARALYFDVPGFIRRQATMLEQENPGALKSVAENLQARESKALQNLKWHKELAVFADLDLNKPAFRNTFAVTRQQQAGGLVTETYRKKTGTEGDITFLSVTMGPDKQVRALQALRQNENPLITSSQNLALTCAPKNGHYRIQAFRIAGRQKPIIFDPLQYLIITEIR
jgi:hypothetical protein